MMLTSAELVQPGPSGFCLAPRPAHHLLALCPELLSLLCGWPCHSQLSLLESWLQSPPGCQRVWCAELLLPITRHEQWAADLGKLLQNQRKNQTGGL